MFRIFLLDNSAERQSCWRSKVTFIVSISSVSLRRADVTIEHVSIIERIDGVGGEYVRIHSQPSAVNTQFYITAVPHFILFTEWIESPIRHVVRKSL